MLPCALSIGHCTRVAKVQAMAGQTTTMVALLLLGMLGLARAETAPKGVTLSAPPFSSKLKCTIASGIPGATPQNTCRVPTAADIRAGSNFVSFQGTDDAVYSARYQHQTPVQLWKKNSKYVASFSTSFTVNIDQYSDEYSFIGGGGIAFAITPSMSVAGSNEESLGLFAIDGKTGQSLGGANSHTVAVEIDISRNGESWDPPAPHVGLDINSARSVATKSLGDHNQLVDHKLGVWVDYNAKAGTMQVRVHKVNVNQTPQKTKSALAISYSGLELAAVVKEFSYVGFSTRVPKATHGAYRLYDWKFSTAWVLGTKLH